MITIIQNWPIVPFVVGVANLGLEKQEVRKFTVTRLVYSWMTLANS